MQRTGATLVEVLVAIFVMGIGLIALLALFPLGAYRMAQAIQDSRTANIAQNADAIANLWNVRYDSTVNPLFTNPGAPLTALTASSTGSSYPVFVDPVGYLNTGGAGLYGSWLAGQSGGIPRSTLSAAWSGTKQSVMHWLAFQDDIVFDTTGYPKIQTGSNFERDIRYSVAYLCQKPKVSDFVVNMTVVIFNRRELSLGALAPPVSSPNEFAYSANFDTTQNLVTITYGPGAPPPVRLGEWILDSTNSLTNAAITNPHAYFYRVVGINDNGTTIQYEVQTPLRGFSPIPNATNAGQVIVLEGVAEVMEKGPGRIP